MNQSTISLMVATIAISLIKGKDVTGIQFEDGSGWKFNYHHMDGKWIFIDLTKYDLRECYLAIGRLEGVLSTPKTIL